MPAVPAVPADASTMTETKAVMKLLTGPATAVRISSRTMCLKFRESTGVGFAQPNGGNPEQSACRHQDGSERIDVDDGIERNPPQHLGRRVA